MDYLRLIDRSKLRYKWSDVTPIFAEPAGVVAGSAAIAFRMNEPTAPRGAKYRCHGA